jgi:hypothetical protein
VTIADHPDYQTCSDRVRQDSTQCAECISDEQCRAGLKCVAETSGLGDADAGGEQPTGKHYCMAVESELGDDKECIENRPFVGSFHATSEGDPTERTYCRPRFTTCAAYLMHGNGPDTIPSGPSAGGATCFSNDSCGLAALSDGYCARVTANTNLCTYECSADLDCNLLPVAVTCDTATLWDGSTRKVCAVTSN